MTARLRRLLILLALCAAARAPALDFWQYPEMADKHSIFTGAFITSFSFDHDYLFALAPELHADYLLPVGFPVSVGLSVRPFTEDFFAFSVRPGYHINLDLANSDLYVLYAVGMIFDGGYIFLEQGPRIGFRRRFGKFFCIHLESGPYFKSINIGVEIKLN